MIRIGLVDDHPMAVAGLETALATIPDLSVLARAGTLAEARELLVANDLDVVLLDVRLEDGNGLQALADRPPRERPAVLVISTFTHSQYVAASVRFGAAGFLSKTAPLPEVANAIRHVAAGGSIFTVEQLEKAYVTLTARERQVLRLAMEGLSNKEIGARMGVARKTVEGHLSQIFERYGILGGRIELSIRAAAEGWLEIEPPRAGGDSASAGHSTKVPDPATRGS
jgi:two-component system, NarL family, response regulator DevR